MNEQTVKNADTPTGAASVVERRVGPLAWAAFTPDGNVRIWTSAQDDILKLAEHVGMELIPLYEVPRGWAVVPNDPTKAMLDWGEGVKEELLLLLEGTANMLRGMTLDPNVPHHAKEAMKPRILELEAAIEKYAG